MPGSGTPKRTETARFVWLLALVALTVASCGLRDRDESSSDTTVGALPEDVDGEAQVLSRLAMVDTGTDFTFLAETFDGEVLTFSSGDSTGSTSYESASTSKLVTAVIIMTLVDANVLALGDHPQDHIASWPTSGPLAEITLAQLLSFTSGLSEAPFCVNSGRSDFFTCAERIPSGNDDPAAPGSEFYYGASHMQIAGHMAVAAVGAESWQDIFAEFQTTYDVFGNSAYDLPSEENPRLSGGMHWTADDYLAFLAKLVDDRILGEGGLERLGTDQLGSASIANSPVLDARGEDWHYGFGVWIECAAEVYDCGEPTRISSPGAFGAYPFIDLEHRYFGIIARQGRIGTFGEGIDLFESVADDLEDWASTE